jgi:hypothetical protein
MCGLADGRASRGRMFMRGVGNKCSLGIIGEFAPIADFAR